MPKNLDQKLVKKPWGEELWIADGSATPYALKRILFQSGNRSSLHVHQMKVETNLVISGTGHFEISQNIFDTAKFLEFGQPKEMLETLLADLKVFEINAGDTITVQPGYVHRVTAKSDLVFAECSSCELTDVVRLQDDTNRGNGKIPSEHND
jgi:oxalate decarboxylase/phosphoglucose isomerase-like protein (cupin superfamily)